jgi:four helix bundle protein
MNPTIKTFKDLYGWQTAHQLVLKVYKVSQDFPSEERFGLISQLRRAAVSITSNIAEGFGRRTKKDKVHFYTMAVSLLYEVESQLLIAFDLKYLSKQTNDDLSELITSCRKLLLGLIKSSESKKIPTSQYPLPNTSRGFTLIEIVVAIALLGLFFYAVFGVLQTSLQLIAEGKIKTTANAIAVEQIERIRSIEYSSLGTYVKNTDPASPNYCPIYDPATYPGCQVGSPAGPITQQDTVSLNKLDFTVEAMIDYRDDPTDGVGSADQNSVITDYKVVEVVVSWQNRHGTDEIVLTTQVSPEGVESSAGGGSIRVTVQDSFGNPVPGLEVMIINEATSPQILQPGITDVDGRRLLSGLEEASGYEVFVNIETEDSGGNSIVANLPTGTELINPNYSYARTYRDGEVWPYNKTTKMLVAPNPDKITVEESQITSLTFIIDETSDVALSAYETANKSLFNGVFFDSALMTTNQTAVTPANIELEYNPDVALYLNSGSAENTTAIESATVLEKWLWFEFSTANEPAAGSVNVAFYYDNAGVTTIVPDSQLPNNSTGFDATSPINLQSIDPSIINNLIIRFNLTSADGSATPAVTSAQLTALEQGQPVSDASLRLFGTEWPGKRSDKSSSKIWKYDLELNTDANGQAIVEDIESDRYRPRWRNLANYTELQTCPKAERNFTLDPNTSQLISSIWHQDADPTSSLTVRVQDAVGNIVYPGANLTLEAIPFNRIGTTNECGQHTFGDVNTSINATDTYRLDISGGGVPAHSVDIEITLGNNEYIYEI